MERFCSKCGCLVSGSFCPQCGTKMENAVNLNKGEDIMPTGGQPMGNSQPAGYSQPTYNNNANYAPMPNYPQNANVNVERTENMTVSQWVGTIILSSLGLIGIIFLLVWAFSDTPQPKKNYARGMLLAMVILFVAGIVIGLSCVGCLGMGLGEFFDYGSYYRYY